MSLTYHTSVLSPQSVAGKSAAVAIQTLDANFLLAKTETQKVSDATTDTVSTLHGEGLLTVPTVAVSASSLAVTIGTFKALIGTEVVYAGGQFTALASQSAGVCYFCADGTFSTTLPTTKSYAIIGNYVSTGSGITSFTVANKLLIPKLVTVTGTVANIVVPEVAGYAEGYVDHSATAVFAIDGLLTLNVTPTTDFYVEELYGGSMLASTSDTLTAPPHQRTEGGFWYKITRRETYLYSGNPTVSLTYKRTGLCLGG